MSVICHLILFRNCKSFCSLLLFSTESRRKSRTTTSFASDDFPADEVYRTFRVPTKVHSAFRSHRVICSIFVAENNPILPRKIFPADAVLRALLPLVLDPAKTSSNHCTPEIPKFTYQCIENVQEPLIRSPQTSRKLVLYCSMRN